MDWPGTFQIVKESVNFMNPFDKYKLEYVEDKENPKAIVVLKSTTSLKRCVIGMALYSKLFTKHCSIADGLEDLHLYIVKYIFGERLKVKSHLTKVFKQLNV